jgi:hypothetical protein
MKCSFSTGKLVWVTNLVHEWYNPFPRTYDVLHAAGFHSNLFHSSECDVADLMLGMGCI